MEIDFLRHFGFPDSYIHTLQKAYGKYFLPLQEAGIQQGRLFEGNHLLVQAPTSSGKTMLAELLFLHHVQIPRSTILLVPTKALANQRFQELHKRYQPLGFKICLSTRDHPAHDSDIRKGDFHLAVIVYEKLLSLLIDSPALLSYTGACVMDELHYVKDAKRGSDIDLLLSRIKQEQHIQRMGLSAIQLDDEMCRWLGMQRLEMQQRPVELRQGVLCQGKFYFREFNSKQESVEDLPLEEVDDDGAAMLEAAEYFYQKNESTLLFFPTRNLCYTAARRMANILHPKSEWKTDVLNELEDSSVKRFLHELLPKRIVIHTSDLTTNERETVETLIQQNEIRVIFATSTLAEGINFPVTNVITTKHQYAKMTGPSSLQSPPTKMPLTYDRLQNMTGRAGRLGYQESGRGMIVTCFPGEIDGLKKLFSPSHQQYKHHSQPYFNIPFMLLKLFALFKPATWEECYSILTSCYYGTISNHPIPSQDDCQTAFQQLVDDGFVETSHNGIYLTGTGHSAASQGISLSSAKEMQHYTKMVMQENQCGVTGLLVMAAMLSELRELYVPVSATEIKTHTWTCALRNQNKNRMDDCPWLTNLLSTPSGISLNHHAAFKKVKLCLDWMDGNPVMELENHYRIYFGLISRLTSETAWLIHSFADMLNAMAAPNPFTKELFILQQQLLFGIPSHALDWCEALQKKWMNRHQALQFIQKGYPGPSHITQEDIPLLTSVISPEIIEKLMAQSSLSNRKENQTKFIPSFLLDASRPDQVLVGGKKVQFTKLQAQLFGCLSHKRNHCVGYETIMNELWGHGFGDRKGLNRLKNQITQKCVLAGGAEYRNLIEVVPGVGMVLRVDVNQS